jgi:drug/metabolite transporter (DMT)-like permease
VLSKQSSAVIAAAIVLAVFLWGGNNAGTKFLVVHPQAAWPPIWTGATRFLCAGLLLLGVLRWTDWLGRAHAPSAELRKQLWWRGGLSLAAYIMAFNGALMFTSVSHVALYLGAAPVWALLWEGRPRDVGLARQRYGAALLALGGVFVLLWPALSGSQFHLGGELLGVSCSVLWTNYGRQCRALTQTLGGVEVSAQTMWRAGALLLPLGLVEVARRGFHPTPWQFGVQAYCIVMGGVVAFAIWNLALRQWPTSKVYLFNNLIPLSSMGWAHYTLGEAVTATFWLAMLLIVAGVVLGQASWLKRAAPGS